MDCVSTASLTPKSIKHVECIRPKLNAVADNAEFWRLLNQANAETITRQRKRNCGAAQSHPPRPGLDHARSSPSPNGPGLPAVTMNTRTFIIPNRDVTKIAASEQEPEEARCREGRFSRASLRAVAARLLPFRESAGRPQNRSLHTDDWRRL